MRFLVFVAFSLMIGVFFHSSAHADLFLKKNNGDSGGNKALFNSGSGDSAPKGGPLFFNKQIKKTVKPPIYTPQSNNSTGVYDAYKGNQKSGTGGNSSVQDLLAAYQNENTRAIQQRSALKQQQAAREEQKFLAQLAAREAEQAAARAAIEQQRALEAAAAGLPVEDPSLLPQEQNTDQKAKQIYQDPNESLKKPKKVFNTP